MSKEPVQGFVLKGMHVAIAVTFILALAAAVISIDSWQKVSSDGVTNDDVLLMIKNNLPEHDHEIESHSHADVPSHSHTQYAPVSHGHNQYAPNSHTHQTNTNTGSNSDFDLEVCQDLNCVDDSPRFNQGDVLFLKGVNNSNDRDLDFKIFDSDGDIVDSGHFGVTRGNFSWQWNIPNNLADDTYTIEIEIDRDEDTIDFIVK